MLFRNKPPQTKPYKFRDLKIYSSTEWLADGQKAYRTVFDYAELSYLYVELSFFNKLLDEEDWVGKIVLSAFRIDPETSRKSDSMCEISVDLNADMREPILYAREGWGSPDKKGFWGHGEYIWEAYINNELVATRTFHVVDFGYTFQQDYESTFSIKKILLFEGPNKLIPRIDRTYLKTFNRATTRYVWVELELENQAIDDWTAEFIFQFYASSGLLKGKTIEVKTHKAEQEDDKIFVETGWGAEQPNSWQEGTYTLRISCLDVQIASLSFKIEDIDTKGVVAYYDHQNSEIVQGVPKDAPNNQGESLESIFQKIDTQMVGIASVKQKVHELTDYLKFLQLRRDKNLYAKANLHSVLLGSPGTGKTTMARLLAKIYHSLGFLSSGHLTEVSRVDLVAQYIGQTAPKVEEVLTKARGGILFIDEAYSLVRAADDSKDYGHEVVEMLVKEMSDDNSDIVVLVAGYEKEMNLFLGHNPGFKSRFGHFLHFEDLLPQELIQVINTTALQQDLVIEETAQEYLKTLITKAFRTRDHSFGNARYVKNLLEKAAINQGVRVMKERADEEEVSETTLKHITLKDVQNIEKDYKRSQPVIPIEEDLLEEALKELESMTGLREVKAHIKELVQLVRFYRQTQKSVLQRFSLHVVFKGNPGTGKTTVARILAKIYKALGILERGHLVETDRQGLVAGFIGQTALKTREKIEAAMGGVLFIDEAYALAPAGNETNDFGKEAVEVLLKQMEEHRHELVVVVAGYTDNMDKFMDMNPGLKSRFDRSMLFEDFNLDELTNIALEMLKQDSLTPDAEALTYLRQQLLELYDKRDKYFGNARTVRRVVQEAVRKQHLRMSALPEQMRTETVLQTLVLEDLKAVSFKDADKNRRSKVGFRVSDQQQPKSNP
ncbi:MAG: AAA family ATPase [Cytophagales bacterium]|nr:MAG: AAA family ATPase [Cytophagales bacterium]TAF59614.1 MAG: AAA family ATPase [Cytophagales bacterium]